MKPIQEFASVVVTNSQQRQLIERLAQKHLDEGGSMLAQVFPDGLRLRVLTPAQTNEMQQLFAKALGQSVPAGISTSAFQSTQKGGAA